MVKSITVSKLNQNIPDDIETDMLFKEVQRDTVGRSGSSPTWGYVYENKDSKLELKGIALHKEYDYDYPMSAYGEKAWSIFGKEILGESVRVPEIDIVEQSPGYKEIISYRLMDNDKEDMTHIKDTLFNKFERDEIKAKKDIYTIDELLECVKLEINDEENYKKVEKDIIQVLLLDAVTNNGDRHALNWGLVRDEKTNKHTLAVFDHASAFIDMFEDKSHFLVDGWSSTYVTVGNDKGKHYLGSDGKKVTEYICKEFPEYFDEFVDKFNEKLPEILEQIKQEKMKIDYFRFDLKIRGKRKYLNKLRSRGELEYE